MEKFVMAAVLSFYSGFFCYCPFFFYSHFSKEYDDRVFPLTHTANISIHKYTLKFLE